ncbi:MAG: ABC transporter ATP-binding protein [Pseudomonadota bacterium]|jgi:ABC-2 type transport system ATP-binding protein
MMPLASRSPGTPPAVVFDRVGYRHGSGFSIEEVSFPVAAGESVGLVGRNGAGKTTLLRCLLDFTRPQHGCIRVLGLDSRDPAARAGVAWVPERFVPPAHLTGDEYLRLQAGLRGRPYDPRAARACLESLDFDAAALALPARQYSKGMAQALGLAAALLAEAPLTVLDEPTSGLDPAVRARTRAALRKVRESGRALLFSSHALDDVASLCDRVVVMHAGRRILDATPAQWLARHPTGTPLEAAFLETIGQRSA